MWATMGTDPSDTNTSATSIREAIVTLYLADVIDISVLQAMVGHRDAAAVQAAASLVDEGDRLAGDLADL